MKLPLVFVVLASMTLVSCVPMVVVRLGDDLQALVDANPPGTRFLLEPGVHRGQQIRPKNGDTFTGSPGTIMSGAQVLSGWVPEGPYWTVSGQTAQGQVHGECTPEIPGYQGCRFPEDLFFDDEPFWQETTLADLDAPGEWFFDYDRDKIYILDDPTGAQVELSVTRHAFHGSAEDVTIQGLTIEKYAPPAQHGAVHSKEGTSGQRGQRWTVQYNVIRLNHGMGISTGDGTRVFRNQIVSNGQLGIGGGGGTDIVVEENTISWNNYAGFKMEWEGGGAKWALTDSLTLRRNHVEGNLGPGLWADIDSIRVVYEDNVVLSNSLSGIFHEISQDAVICGNTVRDNGKAFDVWMWGAQILISSSNHVDVCDNLVQVSVDGGNGISLVQQDRGAGIHGPRLTVENYVHGNRVVYLGASGVSGGVADWAPQLMFNGNNVFEQNTYVLLDASRAHWAWGGDWRNWTAWRAFGHDAAGAVQSLPAAGPG